MAIYLLCAGTVGLSGCPSGGTGSSNRPPLISGTPLRDVKISDSYAFTPTVIDPDGDPLTCSVQNLPRWASFDARTGKISGSPNPGDEGTYNNVIISVSDGKESTSLRTFAITVTQFGVGSITVSWTPPTQNSDGSPLMDLAGYKIYYGTETGNYQTSVQIDNPGIATFVVENLTPTTYYFASTAFNSSGVESSFSNEAIIVVN